MLLVPSGEGRPAGASRIAIVLKGYPRLSETFIAQEILELERRGFAFDIWSLRHPTDRYRHPMHEAIAARLFYLPEYLKDDPRRVLKGMVHAFRHLRWKPTLRVFLRDLQRDPSASRMRRLGQAFVLARELDPGIRHLHVHFLHTPASVTRYAALLTGRSFSFSAHAKDIWTTPEWERREKIAEARWGATCTADGWNELRRVAGSDGGRVELVYHGLDLARFPAPPAARRPADGSDPADPVRLIAVGRAVTKKGLDTLVDALALLPASLDWRLVHIGTGPLVDALKEQAARLGIADRIEWRGSQAQGTVIDALREANLFVLPSRPGEDGDRDGLPNVLMEAATQELPIVSTRFAGVPEFIDDGVNGLLVPPGDATALSCALAALIADPQRRRELGRAAHARLIADFTFDAGIDRLEALLRTPDRPAVPHPAGTAAEGEEAAESVAARP
ncbi:glycosyltransferase family 4 protein [Ancylobacter mangrovi]|uniref:glycosyltransferase family 4 protein n=1 Tax=Ancylobacter mangrovi TaxID=2972472 RepID=UPI0021623E8D|nr:glycosyltransferase family 4 protein [Ancylobacter mangrovi]MCS0503450.1 glycosyltransferase family 4 protein [Ancylobacter mangrovi]